MNDKNEKYKYTLKTIFFKNSSNESTCYYICSDSKCEKKVILEFKNIELNNDNYNLIENFIIKIAHNIKYNKHSNKAPNIRKKNLITIILNQKN